MIKAPKNLFKRSHRVVVYLAQPVIKKDGRHLPHGKQIVVVAKGNTVLAIRELGSNVLTMFHAVPDDLRYFDTIREIKW